MRYYALRFLALLSSLILLIPMFSFTLPAEDAPDIKDSCLVQVTIISRHSVRAPLASYLSSIDSLIGPDRKWPEWSVAGGHLTFRGATLEYMAGEYFRQYLCSNGLMPSPENSYFCASPKQRTVETSRAFAAGFFGGDCVPIRYKGAKDFSDRYLDPNFLPLIKADGVYFDFGAFREEAKREMLEIALSQTNLESNISFLEERLGFKDSKYAKAKNKKHVNMDYKDSDNYLIELYNDKKERAEPVFAPGCDFLEINRASDAFILQYYMQDDTILKKSTALNGLTQAELERLASIKDSYGEILFTSPIISVDVSHNMLSMIKDLMETPGRELNFICSHDSSMAALLAALRAEVDPLENAIERRTPIGFKIVIERWRIDGQEYAKTSLVYHSVGQLRASSPADLQGSPIFKEISFKNLTRTANGMYRWDDLLSHMEHTLNLYYEKVAFGQNPFAE